MSAQANAQKKAWRKIKNLGANVFSLPRHAFKEISKYTIFFFLIWNLFPITPTFAQLDTDVSDLYERAASLELYIHLHNEAHGIDGDEIRESLLKQLAGVSGAIENVVEYGDGEFGKSVEFNLGDDFIDSILNVNVTPTDDFEAEKLFAYGEGRKLATEHAKEALQKVTEKLDGHLAREGKVDKVFENKIASLERHIEKITEVIESKIDDSITRALEKEILEAANEKLESILENAEDKKERGVERAVEKVEDKIEKEAEKAEEKVEKVVEKVEEKVEQVVEKVEEKVEREVEKIEEEIEKEAEKVEEKVEKVVEKVEAQVKEVVEAATDSAAEEIVSAVEEVVEKVQEKSDKGREDEERGKA